MTLIYPYYFFKAEPTAFVIITIATKMISTAKSKQPQKYITTTALSIIYYRLLLFSYIVDISTPFAKTIVRIFLSAHFDVGRKHGTPLFRPKAQNRAGH